MSTCNEPVEFETSPVKVQDFAKPCLSVWRNLKNIPLMNEEKNQQMSTCNKPVQFETYPGGVQDFTKSCPLFYRNLENTP